MVRQRHLVFRVERNSGYGRLKWKRKWENELVTRIAEGFVRCFLKKPDQSPIMWPFCDLLCLGRFLN